MLKGTMKIELTDVKTGQTETVLEHNMVTNALANIFKPLGLVKDPSRMYESFAPYYQKLLGGLLLFDSNIEENADMLYPPAEAQLVGSAVYGQQNNTTGKVRGSFNQTESELNLTDRYMKYVYDFQTSQANGTISCVCLTHANGGYTSYGSSDAVFNSDHPLAVSVDNGYLQYVYTSYTNANTGDKYNGFTVGVTELLFAVALDTDAAYYLRFDSGTKLTITKRRAYLKTVSVLENPRNTKPLMEEWTLDEGFNISGRNCYNFDPATNALYVCGASNYQTKVNETFNVLKIDFGTWKTSTYTITNTSDVMLSTDGMRYAYVHDGFVYVKSYNSPYHVYKFELTNSANVVKLKETGMSGIPGLPEFAINGRIYYDDNGSDLYIADSATNEFLKPESNRLYSSNRHYCYAPVLENPMLYFISCGNYTTIGFAVISNYLATINNLSEPVTKTADKTMKVTYIIQEQ